MVLLRGTVMEAIAVNVFVPGSQSSGVRTAVLSEKGTAKFWPPTTNTLPSGRTTLLAKVRAFAMGDNLLTLTAGPVMSMRYCVPRRIGVLVSWRTTDRQDVAGFVHHGISVHGIGVAARVPAAVVLPVPVIPYQFIALLGPAWKHDRSSR